MLPGLDGLEVCRRLRANPETATVAVVMLTARGAESDIVSGLDAGANDYVTKPFSKEVLLARIRATLRKDAACSAERLSLDGLVLDDETHRVTMNVGERVVRLAIPYTGVRRSEALVWAGLATAGIVGACIVVFVFVLTRRLSSRLDEQERRLEVGNEVTKGNRA